MKIISSNQQYEIKINKFKNRAYLAIFGYWRNVEQVPNYLNDWKKAIHNLEPGFTLLTDASQMKTHPADVRELHEKAQQMVINFGVSQVAEVQENIIAHAQLDAVSRSSQMPKENFKTREEAEEFLDNLHTQIQG